MSVRTRIAPSPTGIAHIGTLYMALFNSAFAQKNKGQFIIRSEDTDRKRFVEGAEEVINEAMEWANIKVDESPWYGGPHSPYRQSERLPIYKKYADQLIKSGHAYYCFATPEELEAMRQEQISRKQPPRYDGRYRNYPLDKALERIKNGESYVIRMRVPEGYVEWHDLIRGHVRIDLNQIDDQVLIKTDGFPTYHLAVVVDDHDMEISHVLRGEEWISSTPKHILLYKFFGWQQPEFAHLPLLRNPDRSKLSKRRNDVSILSYRDKGYLPEALLNYLMLMGWSHPEGEEIISFDQFVELMSLERIQTTGPIFDVVKLEWMNGKYIREKLTDDDLVDRLKPFIPAECSLDQVRAILPLVRERLARLNQWEELTKFFYRDFDFTLEMLPKKLSVEEARLMLEQTIALLSNLDDWTEESLELAIRSQQEKTQWHRSHYFMLLRLTVSGEKATPPLFSMMQVMGKATVLKRMQQALAVLV